MKNLTEHQSTISNFKYDNAEMQNDAYRMFVTGSFWSSVCLRWSPFSPIHCAKYVGLCVISWPISLIPDDHENICTSSYHHQIGNMIHKHCYGPGHETKIYAIYLTMFSCWNCHGFYDTCTGMLWYQKKINGQTEWNKDEQISMN